MIIDQNTNLLITGGTGSFGKAFIKKILADYPHIRKLIIFSRDELKQWELQQIYPEKDYPQLRFFLGDIRDGYRIKRALEGVDIVIHAAALKQVPAAEYNPIEFIKTNVLGADNLAQACIENNVKKLIALSTDKASAPINLYGATKLCSDKLFIAANNYKGSREISFSVVRYGNVMGSRGSVIPLFINMAKNGCLKITDYEMTRFNISLKRAVQMVLWSLGNTYGGEIIVPKIPSYKIKDLAEAVGPSCEREIIGLRPGEKIHEEMITTNDSYSTIDLGNYYAILPFDRSLHRKYSEIGIKYKEVKNEFSYNSFLNPSFLNVKELRELIVEHVDAGSVPI